MVRPLPKDWLTPELLERFWSQVDIQGPDDCWEWKHGLDKGGYGKFAINKRKKLGAHRVAYMAKYGEVDSTVLICHSCDNRKCCNFNHLWPGNHKMNYDDMVSKGRAPVGWGTGQGKCGGGGEHLRVLTEDQVYQIRRRYFIDSIPMQNLGEEYGVKRVTIQSVISGRTWKHVHPVCAAPATRRLIRKDGRGVFVCDAHWADPSLIGEFEYVVTAIPGKKCCFVKENRNEL
jgi:hypothetical protein